MSDGSGPDPLDPAFRNQKDPNSVLKIKVETDICQICGKRAYTAEKMTADNKPYHISCFRCQHCKCQLTLGNYALSNGKLFCKPHFKQLFMTKGNYSEGFGALKPQEQHTLKTQQGDVSNRSSARINAPVEIAQTPAPAKENTDNVIKQAEVEQKKEEDGGFDDFFSDLNKEAEKPPTKEDSESDTDTEYSSEDEIKEPIKKEELPVPISTETSILDSDSEDDSDSEEEASVVGKAPIITSSTFEEPSDARASSSSTVSTPSLTSSESSSSTASAPAQARAPIPGRVAEMQDEQQLRKGTRTESAFFDDLFVDLNPDMKEEDPEYIEFLAQMNKNIKNDFLDSKSTGGRQKSTKTIDTPQPTPTEPAKVESKLTESETDRKSRKLEEPIKEAEAEAISAEKKRASTDLSFYISQRENEMREKVRNEELEKLRGEQAELIKILHEKEEAEKAKKKPPTRNDSETEMRRGIRSVEPPSAKDVPREMKGFLSKQGHLIKNWQVRYFVLKGKEISYYTDETASKLKGKLELAKATVNNTSQEGRDNCFVIRSADKELFVSASSEIDRQNWMNAILQVIRTSSRGGTLSNTNTASTSFLGPPTQQKNLISPMSRRMSMNGWLHKKPRGKKRANKKRWFVLKDDPLTNSLVYFESSANGGSNRKGEIDLCNAQVEKLDSDGRSQCIVVKSSKNGKLKEFLLSTENSDERDKWMEAITTAILCIKEEEKHLPSS